MQIDFKRETIPVSELKWNQATTLLMEGDVIVPDIKPDIREILMTEATPVITDQDYISGKLQIAGTLSIRILYLSDDETSQPKTMDTKFDFKDSLELPLEVLSEISIKAATEHIEFALINSRKLNMKVVVSCAARGYIKRDVTLLTDTDADCPLKIQKKHLSTYRMVADTMREIVISDALEVPSAKPDIDEIIKLDVTATKGDCKIMSGKILLKGSLPINTLYLGLDTEAGIEHMEHELHFSEMVDVDGLGDDCLCHVNYEIKNVYYTVKEDLNGEERIVSVDVVLRAYIMASQTQETEVIHDCYSIVGEAVPKYERLLLDELLSEGVSHENIKEILTVPEGVPATGAVYSLQCKPRVQEIKIADEKIIINGKLAAFVLYGCAGGENPLYSLVGEFDFEHTIPVDGLQPDALCECTVTEQGVSFTLNAASEIELRCVLEFYTRAILKRETSLLADCEINESEAGTERHGMIIYFVQPNDSLWQIAKHYKTDQDKIAQLNKLDQSALVPGQKLLIPRT